MIVWFEKLIQVKDNPSNSPVRDSQVLGDTNLGLVGS